jgi:transposase-like protein
MLPHCPYCDPKAQVSADSRKIVRFGRFYRRSDSRSIQRFRCLTCSKGFSQATFSECYLQNKRQVNFSLRMLLVSGVSQRRAAKILNISRVTVVRKFCFLGILAKLELEAWNSTKRKAAVVEFDDLETFEHTKCKPLSVTLMVESQSRRILDFEVAKMPANGLLASISRKKYGRRKDERPRARKMLFERVQELISEGALIKSDQSPHYPADVRKYFSKSAHQTFKSRRGAVTGQGELKKIGFDPLFSINHSYAMLRANINRLFRRTWCTTKKPERLALHIALYSVYHNQTLKSKTHVV